ncbi:MAG TPA: hypothetical protein VF506_20155 [Streptosporangiaceae bacterium]
MGWLTGIGDAIKGVLKSAIVIVFLFLVLGLIVGWSQRNKPQAQATTDKVMTAIASGIGWGADGITNMTGGSAAEAAGAGGVEVIYVKNEAPLRWHVGGAIKVWNKGLTNVKLQAVQECPTDGTCIKIRQVSELPPQDGRMVLGRTSTFFGTTIRFNGAAVGHVPARSLAVAACHELGHALGAEHRTVTSSCMDAVIGPGVSTRPDATDYAKVNDKYGH